jgi:16S rRNA (cytidine1402-2'-O)-methyltransferase
MTAPGAPVGRLTVCPTPIGNLADITLRVLEELGTADVIACEDTRRTRVLLDRHGIEAHKLVSLHEHNEAARARELSERIGAGVRVALVSDAGTPLVSDPGHALLRECLHAGLPVEVLPGASAAVTALVASGLPGARWCFAGFLPRKRGELRELLAGAGETLVAYESPRRLAATLALLAEIDPARPAAVCRELTKLHEEVARGSAAELAARFGDGEVRGEVTLVLGAAGAASARSRVEAIATLRELVEAGARPRPAAAAVAKLTGLSANELYRGLTGPAE